LTSRLQHLKQGDEIIVSRKATGTLVIDNLEDGRNLYLIGTGTGLAPFLSVIKDPETYPEFADSRPRTRILRFFRRLSI
jgi:ferredoxin--NADP+ reductase